MNSCEQFLRSNYDFVSDACIKRIESREIEIYKSAMYEAARICQNIADTSILPAGIQKANECKEAILYAMENPES